MTKRYDWPMLVTAHAESGLSQQAFCAQRGINAVSFCRHRQRVLRQLPNEGRSTASPNAFVKALPATRPEPVAPLELVLGSLSLRFASGTAPAYIAALAKALS